MLTYVVVPVLAFFAARVAAAYHVRRLHQRGGANAIASLERWATHPLSPVKAEARLLWADGLRGADAAAALEVLAPALELPGRRAVPALLLAAKWALADQWYEHAERHAAAAAARLGRKKDGIVRARIQRFRAEIAVRAGRLGEALRALHVAVEDNPFDAETRLGRAALGFQRGDLETAVGDYAFIEEHFGNPALRVQAALGASFAFALQGNFDAALAHLDRVIAAGAAPQPLLVYRRAAVRALRGDAAGARQDLAAMAEHPDHGAYVLGCIAAAEGEWDEARRKLAAVIVRGTLQDVRTAEALWVMIAVLRKAGQSGQAEEMASRLRALWPESAYLREGWSPLKVH